MDTGTEATIMTEKIRTLNTARRAPDADIIKTLEDVLERARRGEIVDLVVIYTDSADYGHDYKINSDCYAVAGYMGKVRREIEDIDED